MRELAGVLRKRWRSIVAVLIVCLIAGFGLTLLTPKMYQGTSQIFVSTADTGGDAQQLAQGNTFIQARVQSYTAVATSPQVTEAVVKELNLRISSDQLADKITADAPLNKVLINIQVVDRNAEESARLTNAVAQQFSRVVSEIEQQNTSSASSVQLTVIKPASVPTSPVSPNIVKYLGLAAVAGLVLGVGAAAVRAAMDNTISTADELTLESGVPVLGAIPFDKQVADSAIAFRHDARGRRAEAFRRLRTNLRFVEVDDPPRVICVTSALAGEGKSHTSLNLAAALADSGQRVCLIEADLRKPSVARTLGLVADVGLTSVLIGQSEVETVTQNAGANLAVLTSGPVPPNPSELLLSDQFRRVVEYLSNVVDTVIIDTPPLLLVSDGVEIAALADATLMVVRSRKTTRTQVKRATDQLRTVGVQPVGAVLSMASERSLGSDYYYYYGQDETQSVDRKANTGPRQVVQSEELASRPEPK